MNLKKFIRNIHDFPQKGIQFKDITTLINDKEGFRKSIDWMVSLYKKEKIDKVVAVESRGFIFGAPIAIALNAGLVLVRKKGRLPADTVSVEYQLEYGEGALEMHRDSILPGERVIIVDDLLATGGTTKATIELIKKIPTDIVGICYLIELVELNGRAELGDIPVQALIKFEL